MTTPTPAQVRAAALAVLNGAGLTYAGVGVVFAETWLGERTPEAFDTLVAELASTGYRLEIDTDADAIAELDLTVILRHNAGTRVAELDPLAALALEAGLVLINTQLAVGGVPVAPERLETPGPIIDPGIVDHGVAEAAFTVTYRILGATA